jgi:uncharacterized membrane protein YhaH (DUF805 family)
MHWIVEPFRRCFDYSGRSRRMEYWSYTLLAFLMLTLVTFAENRLGHPWTGQTGPVRGLIFLGLAIPGLAVSVRRLHDTDRVGWWTAMPVAPILLLMVAIAGRFTFPALLRIVMAATLLGSFALLALMCVPGTSGPNRFGPDPKESDPAGRFS